MFKPVYFAFVKTMLEFFFLQITHFVKSRAHSPRPTSKIIAMIALRRTILMKANPVVSLHAHRLFSGRACSCKKDPCSTGPDRFVFTMDIKSLYTVIPNNDSLLALRHFLNKRPVKQPHSHTLVRLAELVLTLNGFSFKGDYFQQTGGVVMGSRLGPNYACLFVGHVEEQIFQQYPGKKPDLYKRYIDDIAGAASCSKNELGNFAEFINNFHPSLKFTWAISDNQLPFLDLLLKPTPQGLTTSIHYKETDSHSYLTYTSSRPVRCKNSVPYSQFLRLKRICSDEND